MDEDSAESQNHCQGKGNSRRRYLGRVPRAEGQSRTGPALINKSDATIHRALFMPGQNPGAVSWQWHQGAVPPQSKKIRNKCGKLRMQKL